MLNGDLSLGIYIYTYTYSGNVYSAQWFHFTNVETASQTWWQTSKMESGVMLTNFEMVAFHLAESQNVEWFHA